MTPARVAGCAAINVLVAFAILESPYGTVIMFDEDLREIEIWLPVLTGVVVGCLQTLSFGVRVAVAAGLLGVVVSGVALGLGASLVVVPAVLGALGALVGLTIAWLMTRSGLRSGVVSRVLLAAVAVAAVVAVVAQTRDALGPSDTARVHQIVVWEPGTTVDVGAGSVTFAGQTYRLGDQVVVSGGWVHLVEDDPFWDQIPKSCRDDVFLY